MLVFKVYDQRFHFGILFKDTV